MILHKPPFKLNEIKIELTYQCPLACIHCSSDATPETQLAINPKIAYSLVDQAGALGVEEIAFSGGEPLQYEGIGGLIEKAKQFNMKTLLYTCGNVKNCNKHLSTIFELGLDKIIFSLYSSEEDEHECVTRIRGSYKKTISAIRSAVRLGLNTELHFVALSRNYKRLTDIVELAKNLRIKRTSILRFVPQGRGYHLLDDVLNRQQYMNLKLTIESLRQAGHDIRTGSPFNFLLLSDMSACNSAINRLIIAPDLRIYPCDAFKQIKAEELVGTSDASIVDGNNLQSCWNTSPFLNSVRKYLTSPFVAPCASCTYLENCLSGCLAQKVLRNGNFNKCADPACMKYFFDKPKVVKP